STPVDNDWGKEGSRWGLRETPFSGFVGGMDDEMTPGGQPPLYDLLGSEAPPAGADELRQIVARAERRRWRVAGGALALTLVAGGLAGYFIPDRSSTRQVAATAPGQRANLVAPSSAQGGAKTQQGAATAPGGVPALATPAPFPPLQHLFTRMANGLSIRGFTMKFSSQPVPQPAAEPGASACSAVITSTGSFTAEVSTDKMVATVGKAELASLPAAVGPVEAQAVGYGEGDPRLVVMAQVAANVADVNVKFNDGTSDHMAPVGHWVALSGGRAPAQPYQASFGVGSATTGTVTAGSAKTGPGSTTSGGMGSGSTGSGSTGSGSTGSGSRGSGGTGSVAALSPVGTLTATDSSGRVLLSEPVGIGYGGPQPLVGVAPGCPVHAYGPPIPAPAPVSPPGPTATSTLVVPAPGRPVGTVPAPGPAPASGANAG
ncbi:MAG: hypothetical protein ACR2NJ_10825, partial [Acidimicrobiales bacterium]